jgi:hypothetical protein
MSAGWNPDERIPGGEDGSGCPPHVALSTRGWLDVLAVLGVWLCFITSHHITSHPPHAAGRSSRSITRRPARTSRRRASPERRRRRRRHRRRRPKPSSKCSRRTRLLPLLRGSATSVQRTWHSPLLRFSRRCSSWRLLRACGGRPDPFERVDWAVARSGGRQCQRARARRRKAAAAARVR